MSSVLTLILFFVFVALLTAAGFALLFIKKAQERQVDGLFYESKQGPIFYKVYGHKGPVVLLIHGLGASSYCWREVAPELSRKYKVITLDLWGFGHSSKRLMEPMTLDRQCEVIQELMGHLNIYKYHVVGHSMGGQIAFWLKMNDDRIQRVIGVTPACHPSLVSDWLKMFAWVAKLTPYVLSTNSIKRFLVRSLEDPAFVTEEMVHAYYEPYIDPAAHVTFAAALDIIRDRRVWDNLDNIPEPYKVIWAAHDLVISRRQVKLMTDKFGAENTITHPWSGHLPMEDDCQWLVEQLFLTLES